MPSNGGAPTWPPWKHYPPTPWPRKPWSSPRAGRVQGPKSKAQSPALKVQGSRFRVHALGCRSECEALRPVRCNSFWSGFGNGGDILLKMSDTDLQLLARYTGQHAEDAFAELVRRHLDLVFSAALRQVRSPQLAEEVAQPAFPALARQPRRLAPDTILTAWLYQVTRRTAIDVVRREARRQHREQVACELNAMNTAAADWTHIEPLLDEAMQALEETDRTAVLLRYFENKSAHEMAQTLGTTEDAAQRRVSRAVERLRQFFDKRGVTIGASGLVIAISANSVQAAPAGLAVTISAAAALVGTSLATTATATATATKAIVMTTLQKTL